MKGLFTRKHSWIVVYVLIISMLVFTGCGNNSNTNSSEAVNASESSNSNEMSKSQTSEQAGTTTEVESNDEKGTAETAANTEANVNTSTNTEPSPSTSTETTTNVESEGKSPEKAISPEPKKIEIVDLAGNVVVLDKPQERVIALGTADMEIVYALGSEVVGRTTIAGKINPPEAESVPEVGDLVSIDLEKIAALNPDLIIVHKQLNANSIPALKAMGINVIATGSANIDDIYYTIEIIGKALGKDAEATSLIENMQSKISKISVKRENPVRALIVFGMPGQWMVALPNSLSGNFLEIAGGHNVASDFPKIDEYPQYANINTEKIIEANPDIIFLISPGAPKAVMKSFQTEMDKNPVWQFTNAIRNDHFVLLPNHLFGSNPGPRVVDSLEFLIEELNKVSK